MQWKTMDEWRAPEGPKNGTPLLVLLSDGERTVAHYSGISQSWYRGSEPMVTADDVISWRNPPVAWSEIPDVPAKLRERIAFIKTARENLDKLEKSPLEAR